MKSILLTGASGFVGSHVLRHFLKNTDWKIFCPVTYRHKGVPDRIRLAVTGIDDNYERVEIIRYDLTVPISRITTDTIGQIDYIVNLASESHVDRSISNPADFIQNNVALICNVLDYARIIKPRMVLHISTDEVYGPAYGDHAHEEWLDLYLPSNPYAASKAAQESICFSYWRTYGVPIVITNTMNIIGEAQDPEKFLPKIIRSILDGTIIEIHSSPDGVPGTRHYLHARNQADALLYILKNLHPNSYPSSDKPSKLHIAGEYEISNIELFKMVENIIGRKGSYVLTDFHTSRPGHDLRYALNADRIASLGWKAPVKFDESLKKTVTWYLNNQAWLKL